MTSVLDGLREGRLINANGGRSVDARGFRGIGVGKKQSSKHVKAILAIKGIRICRVKTALDCDEGAVEAGKEAPIIPHAIY